MRLPVLGVVGAFVMLIARDVHAQDAFEIQVYRADVNAPHHVGLELHSNYVAWGLRNNTPPMIPTQGLWHETLEPSLGVTSWWELGGYLQFARAPDSDPQFGGVKLRSKFRLPLPARFPIALGINFEVSYVPAEFESNVWGAEIRPIIAAHPGPFDLAFNPILTFDLAGPSAGIPQFEPAAAALYEIEHALALGVEYYGAFGPVNQWAPWPRSGQYLFAVGQLIAFRGWELNVGVGFGLTEASSPVILKSIFGHEF